MTNGRVAAAILLAMVAVVAAGEDGRKLRHMIRQCKQEFTPYSVANKTEPMWAVKKTISGLYDPRTHHAYRKSVLTIAKFEAAIIRNPKEAEKCMVNCLAEKLRWLNGTTQEINATRVFEGIMAFAHKFNEMARHKKIDTMKLKQLVSKCVIGAAGYYEKECEKGYELLRCVHTAFVQSIYEVPETTTAAWVETTTLSSGPERMEDNAAIRTENRRLYFRRPHQRFYTPPSPSPLAPPPPMAPQPMGMMPSPPPMGMMPPPPPMGMMPPSPRVGMARPMPMQAMPMAQTLPGAGPEPTMIAYGQRSGVVEVFGRRPRYGQAWRDTIE